jgi:acylphosphatase
VQQTIFIIVSGKVQGVNYRQIAKERAIELGITGTVKNLRDGSVHIIATGTKEQLNELINWCRKGTVRAVVENLEVKELPLQSFERFSIER